jgi:D-amino-acid oxidase
MFKKRLFSMLFMALISTSFASQEDASSNVEVRKINPPRLDADHILKKVLCHRPFRVGGPLVNVQEISGKLIGSNYGHSGSGWTLGPGCVKYVLGQLEAKMAAKNMTKDEPITIVGAGVMGLISAMELKERGYTNITIVAESLENITSHRAGGQFAPVFMGNDPEAQIIMDQAGVDSYKYYTDIIHGRHKYLTRGPSIVTDYFANREDFGLEPYVAAGAMRPGKDVILDFQNGTTRKMVAYDDCLYMDVSILMQDLSAAVLNAGIPVVQKKIHSFAEIPDTVILNCSGLGAKELMNDDNMISVQGHLLLLKDQNPADVNYMIEIYLSEVTTSTGLSNTRAFYIFPKHLVDSGPNDIGILGGTYIKHATPSTPHEEEFDIVLQNAKNFYGVE